MRKTLLVAFLGCLLSTPSYASVWQTQCAGCHNGSLAPSKAQLKAKYSRKEFIKKALESSNPMMSAFKNNKDAIQKAADELYK